MKSNFSYKDIYVEDGKKVLEMNILPEKYCNFDCVFCPIGRSKNKIDEPVSFEDYSSSISELDSIIEKTQPDLVFINSKGEALVNDKVSQIIDFIKSKGLKVRLLSNGYILSKDEYINIANKCDEVIGEIKAITEEDFKKLQRPIEGYTLENYIENMVSFNKQYNGKFIFEITIIKKYNDDEESVQKIKDVIKRINPDEIEIVRIDDERMKKTLWVDDKKFEEIKRELINI
ncbi:MAG: radical SAM protein [Intestinibacter bartlettii]|uniref:radical SAM protein n=1 Tax=Intestinibacter bartlettii TaxID=261299 RepID=UPI00242E344C|nr:radical SAM protein [Intestinibacter bartlettii]MBS7148712.1 radical SAM protein [Intestinibacter bartlettii]